MRKTTVSADPNKHDLFIAREFDLPVDLVFRAYTDPEIVAEWMGTKVIKLEPRKHGSFQIETSDPHGNFVFTANGVYHEFIQDEKIIRTFEMVGSPFGVQLEVLQFEKLTDDTSKLSIHVVFETGDHRDQQLQMPFAQGLNMAHNRMEEIARKLKK